MAASLLSWGTNEIRFSRSRFRQNCQRRGSAKVAKLLERYPTNVSECWRNGHYERPCQPFLAGKLDDGSWRTASYAETLESIVFLRKVYSILELINRGRL